MKVWSCTIGWLCLMIGLLMIPATAVAETGPGATLTLSGGVKGGLVGAAGYGFENDEFVLDEEGNRLPPGDTSWGYPEYYGHWGMGLNGGVFGELRFKNFLGLEVGYHISQDNASGYVDKNDEETGETLARINSEQRTRAHHIPLLLKLVIPDQIVRPFLGAGIQLVMQQSSTLEYEQERRASQYGSQQDMADLNERNQIETSSYPLVMAAAGMEIAFGPVTVPMELRVGYPLGFDRAMQERARGEDGQIIYDGVYMGHFAVFTGVLYEFDLVQ